MEIKNLDHYQRDLTTYYGGKSGSKYAIVIDGQRWMIKFPENTKNFRGREKSNAHIPSYTMSPLSEYIGSHVYELLGIPVHETILGYRNGKIVVACKDFDPMHNLVEYGQIKNSLTESDAMLESSSSNQQGEALSDALTVIKTAPIFQNTEGLSERFWDMFVIDAFIRNNDRNNGNWGIFINADGTGKLAPVYDNGNCLFNKRNPSVAKRRILNENDIRQDALGTGVSFFTQTDEKHIHPFQYIESMSNEDCNQAVLRFVDKMDIQAVKDMIDEIPQEAYGIEIITEEQKVHIKAVFQMMLDESILPTAQKIKDTTEKEGDIL